MLQEKVFLLSLILMGLLISVFIYVAFNASKSRAEFAPIKEKAYSFRDKLFWVIVLGGIPLTVATTLDLPYVKAQSDKTGVTHEIDIEGRQWYWLLSEADVSAGDTVVFNVTASDVNHGLGVYNSDLRMLGQTQAMPGYTNSVKVSFDQPGTYKLLCMEYCGLAHHAMVSNFVVKAKQEKVQ